MLVSYDVAFPVGFNWVLAGKLPGIYGGTPYDGCSGGVQSTGANCLTMRMMWRQNGVGEGKQFFHGFSIFILLCCYCCVSMRLAVRYYYHFFLHANESIVK